MGLAFFIFFDTAARYKGRLSGLLTTRLASLLAELGVGPKLGSALPSVASAGASFRLVNFFRLKRSPLAKALRACGKGKLAELVCFFHEALVLHKNRALGSAFCTTKLASSSSAWLSSWTMVLLLSTPTSLGSAGLVSPQLRATSRASAVFEALTLAVSKPMSFALLEQGSQIAALARVTPTSLKALASYPSMPGSSLAIASRGAAASKAGPVLPKASRVSFLRACELYNKGRYSRNRQTYRTGAYWCMWLTVLSVIGLYFYFYIFLIKFTYI